MIWTRSKPVSRPLVEQNAAALVELQELKRQRRPLAAGYASGDKRRALVSDRNKEIRRRYLEAIERYGVIVNLAKQYTGPSPPHRTGLVE